jgi:adenosylcobinamide-GDP ribazoletransferase
MLTGAFMKMKLCDVCDGFGGGWTKEKNSSDYEDSAIGAYGAIGVVLLFFVKIPSILVFSKLIWSLPKTQLLPFFCYLFPVIP